MLLHQLKNDLSYYLTGWLTLEKPDLCFEIRRVAEMYGCKDLYEAANTFIHALFYRLSYTPAFLELSLEELESFLQSDDIAVSETERFDIILRWVTHLQEPRENDLRQLLNNNLVHETFKPETCTKTLSEYGITPHNLFDIFEKGFFRSDSQSPLDMEPQGRQGQEVILVFDNEKLQAFIPGLSPGCPVVAMPQKIEQFIVVAWKSYVYVMGGTVDQKLSSTVWRYCPLYNRWKKVASMLKTAASFGVAVLEDHLYATGGLNTQYNLQIYEPFEDQWQFGTPMQVKRVSHCMVTFQDQYLVVIGGNTPKTDPLYSVEKYDKHTQTWSYMPQLNIGRIEASAISLKDKIYVVGGYSGSFPPELNSCEVYDSLTNKWSLIGPTITPRKDAAITVYHDKVYVLGGNSKKWLPNVEYYCKENKCWKSEEFGRFSSHCQCCTVTLSGKLICELMLAHESE